MPAATLFTVLVEQGAFRSVTASMFSRVLRALGDREIIEQMPAGELILAPQGERITSDRDFYAAFAASEEYLIRHDAVDIGKLPISAVPPPGENLLLGGRRWRVNDIQRELKTVFVSPAKGGKVPHFAGERGEIHTRVMQEIRAVLSESSEPMFLETSGKVLLKASRTMAARAGVLSPGLILRDRSIQWFPWVGTRALHTLQVHARYDGIPAETDDLSITYQQLTLDRWKGHLEGVARGDRLALDLARTMSRKSVEKFDELLTEDLLDEANARDRLDLSTASESARATAALL